MNNHSNENNTNKNLYKNFTQEELDKVEYVLPVKKKKSHKKHAKRKIDVNNIAETDGFIFAQPHNKKKERKRKALKVFGIITAVIASLLIVATSTLFIFNEVGKSAMHNYEDMNIEPPVEEIEKVEKIENDGKTITYNGSNYTFNEKVTTVVLMGVDTGKYDGEINETNGQADAIYVAVLDTKEKKATILCINRDTMVDVNVYNIDGDFVKTEPLQICTAYAYGDTKENSCLNTLTSLQRLFYGMKFDTYFSLDITAIEDLNDAVGGVTVTTDTLFYSESQGREIQAGETVTLYGKDTSNFIRRRDTDKLDSNVDRMGRQKEYISAFLAQTFPTVKSNPSVILDLYSCIDTNSTTNLTPSKMTYLASTAVSNLDSYKDIEFVSIDGKVKKGEYAEFHVDKDSLMEIMLDLFYVKVK